VISHKLVFLLAAFLRTYGAAADLQPVKLDGFQLRTKSMSNDLQVVICPVARMKELYVGLIMPGAKSICPSCRSSALPDDFLRLVLVHLFSQTQDLFDRAVSLCQSDAN